MAKEDEERLLQDDSEELESDLEIKEHVGEAKLAATSSRLSKRRITAIVCFLCVLLIAGGATFGYRREKPAISPAYSHDQIQSTHPSGHDEAVLSPSDYILSKDWDVEAQPTRREFNWTITDVEFNPDGVYRPMIVINNQFPGPLIRANEDDTIVVNVRNLAANTTSIHWHGMYQNGSTWMDGAVGISQCGIAPGRSFTYEFQVKNQYGTYWYHAHQGAQSSDGLVGPLIIHSREEKRLELIPYESDQVVMVSDHYHNLTSQLMMQYLASDSENAEPVPNGALINGRGRKNCKKYPGWKCNDKSPHVDNPKFELKFGKDHKLRFINVGAFAEFQVAIGMSLLNDIMC